MQLQLPQVLNLKRRSDQPSHLHTAIQVRSCCFVFKFFVSSDYVFNSASRREPQFLFFTPHSLNKLRLIAQFNQFPSSPSLRVRLLWETYYASCALAVFFPVFAFPSFASCSFYREIWIMLIIHNICRIIKRVLLFWSPTPQYPVSHHRTFQTDV
ncbi:hypothetical protein M413DRAFT_191078 [Hebeloma cylindrosporum]|uniref:Uncharacterized protein n=1 Tax=Hebeloma cylindrosporum TaxID=76867 RepID=A0A0C3C598_HEBCY|nr:hypothetical protein M413DRAFT_191078 [Hebeloma cylindrosporum h7]